MCSINLRCMQPLNSKSVKCRKSYKYTSTLIKMNVKYNFQTSYFAAFLLSVIRNLMSVCLISVPTLHQLHPQWPPHRQAPVTEGACVLWNGSVRNILVILFYNWPYDFFHEECNWVVRHSFFWQSYSYNKSYSRVMIQFIIQNNSWRV